MNIEVAAAMTAVLIGVVGVLVLLSLIEISRKLSKINKSINKQTQVIIKAKTTQEWDKDIWKDEVQELEEMLHEV